jgi:hypothetical protein
MGLLGQALTPWFWHGIFGIFSHEARAWILLTRKKQLTRYDIFGIISFSFG